MSEYIRYEHWGKEVSVRADLKGKHKEHCLCWDCVFFDPDDRETNCEIANENFAMDIKHGIVTPVWECPKFKQSVYLRGER